MSVRLAGPPPTPLALRLPCRLPLRGRLLVVVAVGRWWSAQLCSRSPRCRFSSSLLPRSFAVFYRLLLAKWCFAGSRSRLLFLFPFPFNCSPSTVVPLQAPPPTLFSAYSSLFSFPIQSASRAVEVTWVVLRHPSTRDVSTPPARHVQPLLNRVREEQVKQRITHAKKKTGRIPGHIGGVPGRAGLVKPRKH